MQHGKATGVECRATGVARNVTADIWWLRQFSKEGHDYEEFEYEEKMLK